MGVQNPLQGEYKAKPYTAAMDEGRKRVLLIAASILAARRLAMLDGKSSPALDACIANAIQTAERIMRKIDNLWPAKEEPFR